jgi:hypothetical protein
MYLVGAGCRTLYDFFFKILQDNSLMFDRKYLITMLLSTILAIMSATVTFQGVVIPEGSESTVLTFGFAVGFTANHIINKPIGYLTKLGKKDEPT